MRRVCLRREWSGSSETEFEGRAGLRWGLSGNLGFEERVDWMWESVGSLEFAEYLCRRIET